jgi:hypothetical protein
MNGTNPTNAVVSDIAVVYDVLAAHQRSEADWRYRSVLEDLHRWVHRFNSEFKLEIQTPVLAVDRTRHSRCYGHYRPGHNGMGLRSEITIADWHVLECASSTKWWEVLGTLLHEMLHAWQEFHGTAGLGNYHNREFQKKALSLGLIVDYRGVTSYAPSSPFCDLLLNHGITVPEVPVAPTHQSRRRPVKLHLWMCNCTKVRVGRAHFNAQCRECGQLFRLID